MTSLDALAHALYDDLGEGLAPLYDVDGTRKDIDEVCYYGVLLPQGQSLKLNVYEIKTESDVVDALVPLEDEVEKLSTYGYSVGVLASLADEIMPEDQLPVLTVCIYLTDLEGAKRTAIRLGASEVTGISMPFDVSVCE